MSGTAEELLCEMVPPNSRRDCPTCGSGDDLVVHGRGFLLEGDALDYRWAGCLKCGTWWNRG